jgi:hypothetical protein
MSRGVEQSPAGPVRGGYGPRRVWTEDELARLVSGRRAGESYRVLAEALGMPESTVRGKCREVGVTPSSRQRPEVPEQVRLLMIGGYLDGSTERQVAARLGYSRATVRHVLDRANVPRRPRGSQPPPSTDTCGGPETHT